MSWLERQFGGSPQPSANSERSPATIEEQMSPGLTADYDWDLREKAGAHEPPIPPEYMGLEGEYDLNGLAKRVAIAFDRVPELAAITTAAITQDHATIVLAGTVPNQAILERMIDEASQVDGTKAIDTDQVTIE